MPQLLKAFPAEPPQKLRTHQIRVLRAIGEAKGPLDRGRIAAKAGLTVTCVTRALGYRDLEARVAWEAVENAKNGGGFPSLLTLGLVVEVELDIDGRVEIGHTLTSSGKRALEQTANITLPPPRSSY